MSACCVGFMGAEGQTVAAVERMAHGQAERLLPMIVDVLGKAGKDFKDIDVIITTLGPGAFTGLRLGLSAAKALGLSLSRPVYGLTSLQALALTAADKAAPEGDFTVLVDTRREEYYAQNFDQNARPKDTERLCRAQNLSEILPENPYLTGDAVPRFVAEKAEENMKINHIPADLIEPVSVIKAFQDEKTQPLFTQDIAPLYLRGADTSTSKKIQESGHSITHGQRISL